MTATRAATWTRPADVPIAWWLIVVAVIPLSLFVHWVVGFAVLALLVIQRARPFDFLTSYLMVVVVGSFINYSNGQVTYQMWILTAFIVFMLYCYVLSRRWDSLVFPKTVATKPLLLFFGLTLVNFVRGLVVGNSARYAGLELLACLALVSGLLLANRRWSDRELWAAMIAMWAMSVGHFALGAYIYSVVHVRVVGVYFEPVPGAVAMMMFNFALREPRRSRMLLWVIAAAPLLAHQFLSFTRGYWFGLIGGGLFSLIVYVGRSRGAGYRLGRAALVLVMLCGLGALGVVVAALSLGITEIWTLAGNRFASSATTTAYTGAASSNVIRLMEYSHVIQHIIEQPIFGQGLGYTIVVPERIGGHLKEQWFVHQNYLLITLKQGLIGLCLWVWTLTGFVRVGVQGRNMPNRIHQSWCTGAAALVVFCMVDGFVHFPLAETNTIFTCALATGVAMSLVATDAFALRWKGHRTLVEGGGTSPPVEFPTQIG